MIDPVRTPLEARQSIALGVRSGERTVWVHARVATREGDVIWIVVPNEPALPPGCRPGVELDLYSWRPTDARYVLRVRVLSRRPDGLVSLRLTTARRVQERRNFRVPVALTAEAVALRSDGDEYPLRLQVRDLSAAGVRARSMNVVEVGDLLRFGLALPGGRSELELRARVVRPVERPWPAEYACEFGAAFVELSAETAEQLIQFTLREQRAQRRKGLL